MPEDTIYQIEDWLRTRDPKKLEIPENLKRLHSLPHKYTLDELETIHGNLSKMLNDLNEKEKC